MTKVANNFLSASAPGRKRNQHGVRKISCFQSRLRVSIIYGLCEALADVSKYDKPNALFQLLSYCLQFLNNNIIIVAMIKMRLYGSAPWYKSVISLGSVST